MEINSNDLATALKNCLSPNNDIRHECEDYIRKVNISNFK